MTEKELESLKLHVAGATVRHDSPFQDLNSYSNKKELDMEFIQKWVHPFYMKLWKNEENWLDLFANVKGEIKNEVALKLLGDFNWRTRQTGAFFAAFKEYKEFTDIIGTHLLKSEVCYAGRIYCLALACFNTPKGVEYLNLYLEYYLKKTNLYFDQAEAIEAIAYLDKINGSKNLEQHLSNWFDFLKNKPEWKREISIESLEKKIHIINNCN